MFFCMYKSIKFHTCGGCYECYVCMHVSYVYTVCTIIMICNSASGMLICHSFYLLCTDRVRIKQTNKQKPCSTSQISIVIILIIKIIRNERPVLRGLTQGHASHRTSTLNLWIIQCMVLYVCIQQRLSMNAPTFLFVADGERRSGGMLLCFALLLLCLLRHPFM